MAGINPVSINTNQFFNFDYSFSSNPDDKEEDDPISALLDIQETTHNVNMLQLEHLLTSLKNKPPSFDGTR